MLHGKCSSFGVRHQRDTLRKGLNHLRGKGGREPMSRKWGSSELTMFDFRHNRYGGIRIRPND